MLRRYQNEGLILLALLLLVAAFFFKSYRQKALETRERDTTALISQIEDIDTMQKLWSKNKSVPQQLEKIKSDLEAGKIRTFEIKKKKAHLVLEQLTGSQLNTIIGKRIASIPVQITEITIERNGDHYRLELQCKW